MGFLEYDQLSMKTFLMYDLVCVSLMKLMAISLQFTDHGIEGVVPLELLPPHVRSRYEGKANDRSKRAKKEDSKVAPSQAEENQVSKPTFGFQILNSFIYIF